MVSQLIEQGGLGLSGANTEAVLFTRRYKYTKPEIQLNNTPLEISKITTWA